MTPELEPRGKKGILYFRASFPGVGQKTVCTGTAVLRDAKTIRNRFLEQAAELGYAAAKANQNGEKQQGGEVERLVALYTLFCEVGQNPVSEVSRKHYLSSLRRVAKWCNAKRIEDLDDTKARIGWRKENPNGKDTSFRGLLKAAASVFKKSALTFYKKQGFTVENPLVGMDLKADSIQPYMPLRAGLRESIEEECVTDLEPSPALVVLLALRVGLRMGESAAARLSWLTEIGPGRWMFRVKEELPFFEPKGREIRDFPLADSLAKKLLALRGDSDSEYLVPGNLDGRQRLKGENAVCKIWLGLKGIKDRHPIHTLRKECGSVLASTYDMMTASHVLGHKNITTTQKHYASLITIPTIGEESPLADFAKKHGVSLEILKEFLASQNQGQASREA